MITKFNLMHAGHVDMDNQGLRGTPVNDRRFDNEYILTAYDKTLDLALAADRLGYHILWLAEHHFQREGYECIPNILMLSVHLAHLTKRLKFGCAFNITPMWHPLRLAEDYALADILTDGRVVFGVGRGYHTREVETFGSPLLDKDANRDLFEEQVEIILKAFRQDSFSHHGKHYDIPPQIPYRSYQLEDITLVPRPKHLPVECWQPIVSANPRGIDFMARHGIKAVIGGGAAPGGAAAKVVRTWQEAQQKYGKDVKLGENLIVGVNVHVSDSRKKAIEEARPFFEENMKMFGPLGLVPELTEEQRIAIDYPTEELIPNLPTLEQAVEKGSWIVGSPEQVIEGIQALQQAYPDLEQVTIQMAIPTPKKIILEQMERFAEEVMPAFSKPETVAAS